MLQTEIETAQRRVRTDAYQMSIGEVVSMYENGEITIRPEFQRLFRWEAGQKSRLFESILLGIPLPPIFVFETDGSKWELIDGLQRLSTLLEFMGKLRDESGQLLPPSVLESTKYLPSLRNAVWEATDTIHDVPIAEQKPFEKSHQLAIRRARLGVEILKRPSDELTKFDLFQRLNAGGTVANTQELRNCIMLMVNPAYFRAIRGAAETAQFQQVLALTEDMAERQRHMELAVRFLVHTFIDYDGKLDVEEYIDEGIIHLCQRADETAATEIIGTTFAILDRTLGKDALRRFALGKPVGRVGLVGLEGIAVGIAKNLNAIVNLAAPDDFVKSRIHSFWDEADKAGLNSPGLRGTTRLQRTVPLGERWFKP
ncbi:DUF262 domain-containing protein [Asticcacaulis sp. 201]|uniref:DUF262 domain-containing protein n=1 Tax=Asticcacaulis sp. 201 TaxID=3028787 RepID=UPI0029167EF4|nr:DUF262 domain-containing protein [Asticcacaulis sp. 201]MDV6330117.1 DUF262 domain-containing protein [Asticcacaulis sp. 201]